MKLTFMPMLASFITLGSCNNFLDKKPDIHMVVPKSLNDARLLLNDYANLNTSYPLYGELGTDDYYVTKENWEGASSPDQRNAYIWKDEPYTDVVQWQRPYKTIYIANQVLDILKEINQDLNSEEYKRNLGGAFFYRAFALHLLTEVHCSAYSESTADNDQGLPLRLNSGIDQISQRSSLKDTYRQIIDDFKNSANSLPSIEAIKGRPSKASAFAGLARVYLNMGNFQLAYAYADSCLKINSDLLDYNSLKPSDALPVPRFNTEVLFPALSVNLGIMGENFAIIDTTLLSNYNDDDLRKEIFFNPNTTVANSFRFKGSYDQSLSNLFVGITKSEIYLIKAESACRIGRISDALVSLNTLLKMRYKTGTYKVVTENDKEALLQYILEERRKELIFRGRRWSDLKRLNLEASYKRTLIRNIGGEIYMLEPNSPKYAFRLSETLINISGMTQNKR